MNSLNRMPPLVGVLFAACAAFAQSDSGSPATPAAAGQTHPSVEAKVKLRPMHTGSIVIGAPYAAEETRDAHQTLSDGTHIALRRSINWQYRDSQGRTRTERPFVTARGESDAAEPRMVEIGDPVAGFSYILDVQNHVAHRYVFPANTRVYRAGDPSGDAPVFTDSEGHPRPTTANVPPLVQPDRPRPTFAREPLGTQTIEGVTVEGERTTTTFPTGFEGNDRPIVRVCERWFSRDLHLTLSLKCSDPRTGETNVRLVNVQLGEPDRSLFEVPPDYTVVDDTEPVTITYSAR